MNRQILTVSQVKQVNRDNYYMELQGDTREIHCAGQFIDILLPDHFLRRPISIYDYAEDRLSILFKTVGSGTRELAGARIGDTVDVLLPLGNGFHRKIPGSDPVLVGGGIGMPPIYCLAKEFAQNGFLPKVILGFNRKEDILPLDGFQNLGIEPVITTTDGSMGIKGLVTDAMEKITYDYVFCCGPEPMLKAVYDHASDGQFSFEERMGCGFGACMGCSCRTKYGFKRICKDGPVLERDEIIW